MSNEHEQQDTPVVGVYRGEALAAYGFGHGHPFGTDRHDAFWAGMEREELDALVEILPPLPASREDIELFHTPTYVDLVADRSRSGTGLLDHGDTPAFRGVYEAASNVVGSAVDAVARLMEGSLRRAFVPIAGLHHARRDRAGGFCVFNDCGVAIEVLLAVHGLDRVAYVDIDAHHGDGVLYAFESDPRVVIADIHEDGRSLYPGSGWAHETGGGAAQGTKLNLPLPPGAGDEEFRAAWERVEAHVEAARPQFVVLQCGADGLAGDPITHLELTTAAHQNAAARLCTLADRHCSGRILALGGGGYDRRNLAEAWCGVVRVLLG